MRQSKPISGMKPVPPPRESIIDTDSAMREAIAEKARYYQQREIVKEVAMILLRKRFG